MHDLRKQALLESGKTTSRKARSKQAQLSPSDRSTPGSSRNASRQGSRQGSRHGSSRAGSEDEGELSDTTEWSRTSMEDLLADADDDDVPAEKPPGAEHAGILGIVTSVFSSESVPTNLDEQLTVRCYYSPC